jgi:hypothetical protein
MKTRQIGLIVLGVLAALWLAGCSTPATRIKANPEAFARLTPQQQALVQVGQITLGFDQEAVKLALGDPDRVAVRTDADGETIIWHYVTYESNGRMLFTGYYHTGRHWWRWGAAYPYYLDFPDRRVRDRFRVDFKRGVVSAITEDRSS